MSLHVAYRVYQLAAQLQLKRSQNHRLEELIHFLSIQKNDFEVLAKTYVLTGVSNRAGTRDLLQHMQNQQNIVCSLIMFDIDDFKDINDGHRHEVGDQVLQNLTLLVKSLIRDTDHLARWGEEFIVLCLATSLHNAMSLANNLREKIASAVLSKDLTVICSFGLAQYHRNGNATIEKLFESADKAMYTAKNAGQNRVEPQLDDIE